MSVNCFRRRTRTCTSRGFMRATYLCHFSGGLTNWLTGQLTPRSRVLREKLTCRQWSNSPHFMVPEGSLQHSQAPTTCPYPEPQHSSWCLFITHPTSWRYILILSFHLCLGVPSGLFLSGFPTKALYAPFLSHICATCPAHLTLFYLITRIILEIIKLLVMQSSWLHWYLLGPNVFLSTPFSNTLSLCSSLSVRDRVSRPYKTTGKIVVLNILIIMFLDSKLEDKRFCTKW